MIISLQASELQDVVNLFVNKKVSLSFNNGIVIKTNVSIIPVTVVLNFNVVNGILEISISKIEAIGINISSLVRQNILSSLPKFNNKAISVVQNQNNINVTITGITLQQISITDQFLLTGTFSN